MHQDLSPGTLTGTIVKRADEAGVVTQAKAEIARRGLAAPLRCDHQLKHCEKARRRTGATHYGFAVLSWVGREKTSKLFPELGLRICPASSGAISVDQLPPPIPAGMAMYCFPLAK